MQMLLFRKEAILVHILSLYSEETVCDFRGGVTLYTFMTQVNILLLEFVLKKQRKWLEKYCNRDDINLLVLLSLQAVKRSKKCFLRFLYVLLEKNF